MVLMIDQILVAIGLEGCEHAMVIGREVLTDGRLSRVSS